VSPTRKDPVIKLLQASKYPEENVVEELNKKNLFQYSKDFRETAKEACSSVEFQIKY